MCVMKKGGRQNACVLYEIGPHKTYILIILISLVESFKNCTNI